MAEMKLPQLGDSVADCLLTTWLKKPGEPVAKDEPLVEVTTDKVTIEIPSDYSGTIEECMVQEGDRVAVGSVICRIAE